MAAEELIERITEKLQQRLAHVLLPSPAYAVALEGDAEIYPLAVSVGLEPLRVQALSSYPPVIAFAVVWTSDEWELREELVNGDEIAALASAAKADLQTPEVTDGMGAEGYVLGKVARRITLSPPLSPVTDDFLAFVSFPGEADDLTLEHLHYAAPAHVATRLRAKGLLPDDMGTLSGAREWLGEETADVLRIPREPGSE
jgi:hypothetical protein